jgi:hypothetical protein
MTAAHKRAQDASAASRGSNYQQAKGDSKNGRAATALRLVSFSITCLALALVVREDAGFGVREVVKLFGGSVVGA